MVSPGRGVWWRSIGHGVPGAASSSGIGFSPIGPRQPGYQRGGAGGEARRTAIGRLRWWIRQRLVSTVFRPLREAQRESEWPGDVRQAGGGGFLHRAEPVK